MEDGLSAVVPRRLRVRASVQLMNMRISARLFVCLAGLFFLALLTLPAGVSLQHIVRLYGALGLLCTLLLEWRPWGRAPHTVALLILRHRLRSRQLRLAAPFLLLPTEPTLRVVARRPRWQPSEDEPARLSLRPGAGHE